MFGNQDKFSGLGVFLDTYSNFDGDHAVSQLLSGCNLRFMSLLLAGLSVVNAMERFSSESRWNHCLALLRHG